jgi:hypothetical protein
VVTRTARKHTHTHTHAQVGCEGRPVRVCVVVCVSGVFLADWIPMRRLPERRFADEERGEGLAKPEKKRGSGGEAPGKQISAWRVHGELCRKPGESGRPSPGKPTVWQPPRNPLVCVCVRWGVWGEGALPARIYICAACRQPDLHANKDAASATPSPVQSWERPGPACVHCTHSGCPPHGAAPSILRPEGAYRVCTPQTVNTALVQCVCLTTPPGPVGGGGDAAAAP